jgi:hypothetical protein
MGGKDNRAAFNRHLYYHVHRDLGNTVGVLRVEAFELNMRFFRASRGENGWAFSADFDGLWEKQVGEYQMGYWHGRTCV